MLPCRSRILFNLDCWNSCLRLCSNHLLNINGNIDPNVRAKFSTKVYIVSQLNADKVKDELEKFYPNDVAFELVPISKAKEGTFMRDLWLEQEDLEKLNDAEIILCDNMFIPQILTSCSKLKWIQGAYAGVDTVFRRLPKFFKSGEYPSIPVTRFSGKSFGKLISQYCLGYIIAVERNFIKFRDNQHTRDWSILLSQQSGLIYRSLDEITVTVLGFGPIGKDMCKCFSSLGCKVTAFARNPKTKEDLESFGATTFTTNLSDALSNTDYIVAILPDTPDTIGLLNGNVLSVCSAKKPTLINVGRGSLISSVDVIKALDNEWISNAVLDVFEVEPLPADNPLWTHPKVIITPHISAKAQPKDLAEIFRDNFEHFKKGEPLELQIDWKSGY